MPYIIGIDGGGTKTTCAFQRVENYNHLMRCQSIIVGDGTNVLTVGVETMKKRLHSLINEGLKVHDIQPSEVIGICAGIAGTRLEKDRLSVVLELKQIAKELHLHEDIGITVKSDLLIALRGAMHPENQEGILVISGTGSNAIGLSRNGDLAFNGGWGHILGDEGSGYSIGLQALSAVCKAYDCRESPTQLTGMILARLQLATEHDLVQYIYRDVPNKQVIASLARLVIESSIELDPVAVNILKEAGNELVDLVRGLRRKSDAFHELTPVTVAGSIFMYSDIVRNQFMEGLKVHRLGCYQPAFADPVNGAVIVAMEAITKQHL
ncbi:N-acetylglucosamine kinase [Paenibacillus oryzisoli]|uniref:ATPase BadF/BadG/BcrA/BcrD type domain-containing protein n=1 Tax=Paenibacillus oryzisoli TaxID=1850517 RepID=A0A197ZYW5_9BACL|nr:BadF/BadG/BcrA/BcrD ATPase family protein [Paenibacillus oryzisoli]OAS13981.1 hypothetical protein A8708_11430 [Paenibacillus oryzisoli]